MLREIQTIDNFLTLEEIREVTRPLREEEWHWLPPGHVYWNYAYTTPMAFLHERLMQFVPDAIPNFSFFFRYEPRHQPTPKIHTDTRFGEENIVVYLTGQVDQGTGFWRHRESGAAYHTRKLGEFVPYGEDRWEEYLRVDGKPGRAVRFSVDAYHKAFPERVSKERIIWVCRYNRRREAE